MSASSTPNDSPIAPLHQPDRAAQIVVPQAPLGNATNCPTSQAAGLGAKALLAKRLANSRNPMYVSPTDSLMTPCTRKLHAVKEKHYRNIKPVTLFSQKPADKVADSDDDKDNEPDEESQPAPVKTLSLGHPVPTNDDDDEENPF